MCKGLNKKTGCELGLKNTNLSTHFYICNPGHFNDNRPYTLSHFNC